MGIPALLRLRHKDIGAFFAFCLVGMLVGLIIPDPTWALYTGALVADHFFLGWLVFMGEEKARRSVPIMTTISLHLIFVVVVVILVALRNTIHYFNLLPYPLVAIAIWILSGAISQGAIDEQAQAEPQQPARPRSRSILGGPMRTRSAAKTIQPQPPAAPIQRAASVPQPLPPFSEEEQPEWAKQVLRTIVAANREREQAEAAAGRTETPAAAPPEVILPRPTPTAPPLPVQPEAAIIAPPLPPPAPYANGDLAFNIAQMRAAVVQEKPAPEPAILRYQPPKQVMKLRIEEDPQSELPFDMAEILALGDLPELGGSAGQAEQEAGAKPANDARQLPLTIHEASPDAAKGTYRPMVQGVVVEMQPARKPVQSESEFLRDNSIAESIRQKHPDELTRLNPILAATAEDHEEWLKLRGTQDPTHRKIGVTVREEYEQWLTERALARAAKEQEQAKAG